MITHSIIPKTLIENKCKREFVPCEDLFPKWITARARLESWFNKMGDIEINVDRFHSTVNIMFVLPEAQDLITGDMVFEHLSFPIEDQPQVQSIVESVVVDYAHPDYGTMLGEIMRDSTINNIWSMHREVIDSVINMGGRTPLDELHFRLGLGILNNNSIDKTHTIS